MSPITAGAFRLTSVKDLPNVAVAFPGEHWSNGKASEVIVPGELIVPISSGGKLYWARAGSADGGNPQSALALQCVQPPDPNIGPNTLGPNQLVNKALAIGDYVHAYRSGAFNLTLFTPDAGYLPAQLLRFDPGGARPTGKGGTGSWTRSGATPANAFFEVTGWRPLASANNIGVLEVRSLRGQF